MKVKIHFSEKWENVDTFNDVFKSKDIFSEFNSLHKIFNGLNYWIEFFNVYIFERCFLLTVTLRGWT